MKHRIFDIRWIFYTFVSVFFVVFFTQVHPIVPYDGDDWLNIIIERPPYPWLDCWNPTKVLPECLEPLVATAAGYLLVPLIGDYISSLIIANALVVTIFIVVYLISVQQYLEWRFKLNWGASLALMTIFILSHLLILHSGDQGNEHLWYTNDANCYYHYIIPNMLCASLVLWLMRHDIRTIRQGRTIATLLVLTYLALCSNLYSTVILIAYLGAVLVRDLFDTVKSSKRGSSVQIWLLAYVRRNVCFLTIIVLWAIVQWIEANGIRANAYGYMFQPLGYCLKVTLYNFLTIRYNLWFLLISIFAILGAKIYDVTRRHSDFWHIGKWQSVVLLALGLSSSYLILLSSRVDPLYIQRGDVIFEFAFFFLLLAISSMAYLCRHIPQTIIPLPCLIVFMILQFNAPGKTFKDVMDIYEPDVQYCIDIDRNIVQQICDADATGQDSVTIIVPRYPFGENWPVMSPRYASQYYGRALYRHNQTKREIKTIFTEGALRPQFEE